MNDLALTAFQLEMERIDREIVEEYERSEELLRCGVVRNGISNPEITGRLDPPTDRMIYGK